MRHGIPVKICIKKLARVRSLLYLKSMNKKIRTLIVSHNPDTLEVFHGIRLYGTVLVGRSALNPDRRYKRVEYSVPDIRNHILAHAYRIYRHQRRQSLRMRIKLSLCTEIVRVGLRSRQI